MSFLLFPFPFFFSLFIFSFLLLFFSFHLSFLRDGNGTDQYDDGLFPLKRIFTALFSPCQLASWLTRARAAASRPRFAGENRMHVLKARRNKPADSQTSSPPPPPSLSVSLSLSVSFSPNPPTFALFLSLRAPCTSLSLFGIYIRAAGDGEMVVQHTRATRATYVHVHAYVT